MGIGDERFIIDHAAGPVIRQELRRSDGRGDCLGRMHAKRQHTEKNSDHTLSP
jgi:hypothetical protein